MRDPVFQLVRALYGHPESGGHWEAFAHAFLIKEGWTLVEPNAWRSVYYHAKLETSMILYVDDFRLSGPEVNMPAAWKTIQRRVSISDPEVSGEFLGCDHKCFTKDLPAGGRSLA